MNLVDLRYFVEIATCGSLSKAAARLSISQPTLSRCLNKLEREMYVELFYRHGRGVRPTEAGQRLLDVVTVTLRDLDLVKNQLQARSLDDIGEVTLGMPPSIASTVGADLSMAFSDRYPRAKLRIHEAFSGILFEWIEVGRLDLAVLYDARRGSILSTPLLLEDLFLIEAANGETPSRDNAAVVADLSKRCCLLTAAGNGLRRVVDAACWSERIQPQVKMEIDCVAALKQLVERGVGCTVLPFGAVHREVQQGRLIARPFHEPSMRAMLGIATPTHKPVGPMVRATINMLQTEVRRLATAGILLGETRDLTKWSRQAQEIQNDEPRAIPLTPLI